MKTRVKLLLAGMILVVAAWGPAPAEAFCRVPKHIADSEEECEQDCYAGGCYSYSFNNGACSCSY